MTVPVKSQFVQLMEDIHAAHYAHGFKFSSEGWRLLTELRTACGWSDAQPLHRPEDDPLRAEHTARGSKLPAGDVHGDMFNARIKILIRDAKAQRAAA